MRTFWHARTGAGATALVLVLLGSASALAFNASPKPAVQTQTAGHGQSSAASLEAQLQAEKSTIASYPTPKCMQADKSGGDWDTAQDGTWQSNVASLVRLVPAMIAGIDSWEQGKAVTLAATGVWSQRDWADVCVDCTNGGSSTLPLPNTYNVGPNNKCYRDNSGNYGCRDSDPSVTPVAGAHAWIEMETQDAGGANYIYDIRCPKPPSGVPP